MFLGRLSAGCGRCVRKVAAGGRVIALPLPLSTHLNQSRVMEAQASGSQSMATTGILQGQGTPAQPAVPAAVLAATEDKYDGIIIDPNSLPTDVNTFTTQLLDSIKVWQAAGKRGIWLQVPTASIQLVAPAVQQAGFQPHHAEPGHIMLTKWLPNTPCTLPPNASHQVGVGAIVVNKRQELLVVQERSGPLRGRGVWKMPTGLIHTGEDLHTGAEREVLEETGIRARFDCVLALRQAHGFAFGKSDIFIMVGLVPEEGQEDLDLKPQESEVVAVKWMPLQEYLDQPFMQGVKLYEIMRDRAAAYARGEYRGWTGSKMEAGFLKPRVDLLLWGTDHVTSQN